MKILKYLFFTALLLILIFLSFGWIHPSVHYGHEITVNKPVQEAWAVTQDDSKYNQWLKGFKSIELLNGEKGAPGSTYKVVVNPGEGQPDFEMIETLVSIEEFDHVDLSFDSDMMEFKQRMSFTEADGKTTIQSASEVIGKSMLSRSLFAMMEIFTGGFTKQETENFENLKTLIENNTTDYYPAPAPVEGDSLMVE
ncbi:MAG: SRPBCC family protein [Saprospiraceae bacterium]|nr:SRPBCC family protein [Saprospiraceae bacterium]